MAYPLRNLFGMQFGSLRVVRRWPAATPLPWRSHRTPLKFKQRVKHALWLCRCSCGREIVVRADNLLNGFTRSCGTNHEKKPQEWELKAVPMRRSG